MFFGLDGVEISLIIVFFCLFGGIMTGFPVAFAIAGSAVLSFGIIAMLDAGGILVKEAIDTGSAQYQALLAEGVARDAISHFRYPDLPQVIEPLLAGGWEEAMNRNLSFIVNRMNERVFAGPSIETLLAVAMFVMMGITLERSRIADDLLTTMARVFGPLPGGLAVSIVVVGAFLAASTGIVGATVVTMGLLALPTMLRAGYSPELSTGVIAASGTLGQIIPPSIVIVLLGTLAGDIYSTAQEARAQSVGCGDALTYLGSPAVLSVGTLFQAAVVPGLLLALLYALYAFVYALLRPENAPPIASSGSGSGGQGAMHGVLWFLAVPAVVVLGAVALNSLGLAGSQRLALDASAAQVAQAELRTNVSPQCQEAMIALHGQEKWDRAVAQQEALAAAAASADAAPGAQEADPAAAEAKALANAAPIGSGLLVLLTGAALIFTTARGVAPTASPAPLFLGGAGIALSLLADILLLGPLSGPGQVFLTQAIPFALILWAARPAVARLARNELLRVVFPPLVLVVAVLGSILGGVTNPTPAAALGAAGALMLAAYRRLRDEGQSGRFILVASFALVILLLVGVNFDLRMTLDTISLENRIAFVVSQAAYSVAMFGLLFSCFVLLRGRVLRPVVRETAKVTSMVFAILIGSQLLNLVVISFGGEHYIQSFLRSFDSEFGVFLLVMLVLFILGFVLDFLEIIYIVVPIVGPVIYGGALDPAWVTIMIAVNLQTSFLTPPFGFALFYLRGVAPASVTTGHIYRGVVPFVLIQMAALILLWLAPGIVTFVPALFG